MDYNIVSALSWVSRNYAKRVPIENEFEEEQMAELKKDPLVAKNINQDLGKLNEYDDIQNNQDNNEDADEPSLPVFTAETEQLKINSTQQDTQYPFGIEEMSEEEKEDYQIKKTDALIIAAKIENEFSSLEIYVYDESNSNLYVHHEIMLSAFPLAVEWLSINPSTFESEQPQKGNFAIVSTFLPEIEIWDLDVVNAIQPCIQLGGEIEQAQGKKVKKFKQKKKLRDGSHEDSVLCLNLHPQRQNILSSGSADCTVKLWDLGKQQNIFTYKHHKDKVQVVKWSNKEESILLSGGYDKKMFLFDVRNPDNSLVCNLQSEIESAVWDPMNQNNIILSTSDGYISQIDARKFNLDYIFHLKAHDKPTTSVAFSPEIPGLLATTSEDNSVKIWDTCTIENKMPKLICIKNPKAGKLFCGQFYKDSPWVLACGNSNGELFVWDTTENKQVVQHFAERVEKGKRPKLEECTQNENQFISKRKLKNKNAKNDNDSQTDSEMDEEREPQQQWDDNE